MEAATPTSWKTRPLPAQREQGTFVRQFSAAELALLQLGLIPQDMDDRWFIYLADNVLHFHRSWTGCEIFQLPLTPTTDGGAAATTFWVSRDPAEYRATSAEADHDTLTFLIDRLLLDRPAAFSNPAGLAPE